MVGRRFRDAAPNPPDTPMVAAEALRAKSSISNALVVSQREPASRKNQIVPIEDCRTTRGVEVNVTSQRGRREDRFEKPSSDRVQSHWMRDNEKLAGSFAKRKKYAGL